MANTTYCDPPFFNVLRYLDISKSKTMILNAMLVTKKMICKFLRFLVTICNSMAIEINDDMFWIS